MRRGAIARFTIMLATLAAAAYAAPLTVGPLDGQPGPKLPAVAMPAMVATEKLASTAFPATLEQMEDYPSAILEWQRVAYQSNGPDRLHALTKVAQLQTRLGQNAAAANTYQTILREYPATPQTAEILYNLTRITSGTTHTTVLTSLKTAHAQTVWGKAALMENVWQQARAGRVTQTFGLPQAQTLQKRLAAARVVQTNTIAMAGAIGVVPGAGHAYLGQWGQGAVLFIAWALFLLAFLSACRHRHYAYAFVFVVPAMALWLSSPANAIALARQEAAQRRAANLAKWSDLAPQIPAEPAPPPAPTLTESLTQSQ